MSEISLLEKLGNARIEFQAANIKKTGVNNYVGFDYYELHDILPKINELSVKYRFICAVSFLTDKAYLRITDIDDQSQHIDFISPMAAAKISGAHDIQNMGAVQTYMRRYLYMMAFEITECDTYDRSKKKGADEELKIKAAKVEVEKILNAADSNKRKYFSDKEIQAELNTLKDEKDIENIRTQYKRLWKTLKERKGGDNGK